MTLAAGSVIFLMAIWLITRKRALVLHLLQSVYHRLPVRKNGRDKGEALLTLTAKGLEGIRQTLYLGNGVGVYQGEAVTIQEWALSNPPQWVIGKLNTSDLHLFERDIVCELLETALLIAHHIQSEPSMNGLQNQDEISLSHNCPHTKLHLMNGTSSLRDKDNFVCSIQQWISQLSKLPNHGGQLCPFAGIIYPPLGTVNHNGKEPN